MLDFLWQILSYLAIFVFLPTPLVVLLYVVVKGQVGGGEKDMPSPFSEGKPNPAFQGKEESEENWLKEHKRFLGINDETPAIQKPKPQTKHEDQPIPKEIRNEAKARREKMTSINPDWKPMPQGDFSIPPQKPKKSKGRKPTPVIQGTIIAEKVEGTLVRDYIVEDEDGFSVLVKKGMKLKVLLNKNHVEEKKDKLDVLP